MANGVASLPGVAAEHAFASIGPPIPWRGLEEVFSGWSGQGQLWQALGSIEVDRSWSADASYRRAMRVLFAELIPAIERWPSKLWPWLESLPAVSERRRELTPMPTGSVDWRETWRLGWPPRAFVSRPRVRVADTLLVTVLRWTLEQLADVHAAAVAVEPRLADTVRGQLAAAFALFDQEPVASAPPARPTAVELAAIRTEGTPWTRLVPVADSLRQIDQATIRELAERLVAPDEAWRLFHLGVLGEVLIGLRDLGAKIVWRRPLALGTKGPQYELNLDGTSWDLWFEAAGAWAHYGAVEPYKAATASIRGAGSALGADLALIRHPHRALLIECKYSPMASYVARDGFRAALAYAAEAHKRLVTEVVTVVVGPTTIVPTPGWATTTLGPVGIIGPKDLGLVLRAVLHGNQPGAG